MGLRLEEAPDKYLQMFWKLYSVFAIKFLFPLKWIRDQLQTTMKNIQFQWLEVD